VTSTGWRGHLGRLRKRSAVIDGELAIASGRTPFAARPAPPPQPSSVPAGPPNPASCEPPLGCPARGGRYSSAGHSL